MANEITIGTKSGSKLTNDGTNISWAANGMGDILANGTNKWVITDGGLNTTVYTCLTPPSADTCTYSSGNWLVTCSDNCTISTNVDLANNNLIITGAGTFTMNANISRANMIAIDGLCKIAISGANGFK